MRNFVTPSNRSFHFYRLLVVNPYSKLKITLPRTGTTVSSRWYKANTYIATTKHCHRRTTGRRPTNSSYCHYHCNCNCDTGNSCTSGMASFAIYL